MRVRLAWPRLALLIAFTASCSTRPKIGVEQHALSQPAAITAGADELRTGWYPNQAALSPALVAGNTFGQLFSTPVHGQVYAQPLVVGSTVFLATESNDIYGLDAETGAVQWTRNLGVPFNASDVGCGDLTPTIGVTGTPVVDSATNTAYFFSKTYDSGAAAWFAHAVDVATGNERSGFPVAIAGSAANDPSKVFVPKVQMQRPGLLLLDGVVYAAF